jgi:hypothetical protein
MMGGRPADITVGGACAFQLPYGPGCAGQARSLLGSAMSALGLPRELIDDGELAVSELATNAYQHAGRPAGPDRPVVVPELWVWARMCPAPQLVVSVFDADRTGLPRMGSAGPLEERGKGLGIVAAVSACWGCHPSRGRLGNRLVAGKATWCALPLPASWPDAGRLIEPSAAAQELVDALASRGVDASRRSDDKGVSVVQAGGLNVWVGPTSFSWRHGAGGYVRHPLVDLHEVAEQLVRRHEESDPAAGRSRSRPHERQTL